MTPAVASGQAVDWQNGTEIDPAKVFDKTVMVRTFIYDGVEWEDLSLVYARDNVFRVSWFSDYFIPYRQRDDARLLAEGLQILPVTDEEINASKEIFVAKFCSGAYDYPSWDMVAINGEPWQLTDYADVIIKRVGEVVKPNELLGNRNSDAWAMFMDPRTNGASHVWFGDPYSPDYPASRWTAVLDYTVDKITMYNPLNNGQPFDFDSWENPTRSSKSESPANKEPEPINKPVQVEVFPNPAWRQAAVMVMGSIQVTIINNGVTKTNILSVAPEVVAGRTVIPLRGVLDELGYELNYNGEEQRITLNAEGQDIILTVGKGSASVNSIEVELDQPPIIKDGRALVPLRFLAENLGFEVHYENGKITIFKQ